MLFNPGFANNAILSCYFLIFQLLISVITQFFNHTTEHAMSIGITTKEDKRKLKQNHLTQKLK